MTLANLKYVLKSLGYTTDQWIETPTISRINLASDSAFYWEDTRSRKAEYYFDTTNNLVYKRYIDRKTNKVINIAAIFGIDEICHIATRNARSETMFNSDSYLRN